MSGAKDRNRGADTERALVKGLRLLGFPHADRTIRTGHGSARDDLGDVDGTPGLVWQVKSMRPATRAEACVPGWLAETEQQRAAANAALGVLVVRRELFLPPRWWAFLTLGDLYGLANGLHPGLLPDGLEAPARGIPVRLELADACTLLRGFGFGEPLEATP